jgi:6-pyruvoyltetrahydropterin/6-carboxytetrahydropterin synthase
MSVMKLMREVRCFVGEAGEAPGAFNSWAGYPGSDKVVPYVTLRATVTGPVDPQTGYLCNISEIDALLRETVVPRLRNSAQDPQSAGHSAGRVLREVYPLVGPRLPHAVSLETLEIHTSPYLRFSIHSGEETMIHMTQSFEFSASHRLHCPELSDSENERIFGKCSNPNGHGHNYVLEVTVSGVPDAETGRVIELRRFQQIVNERVIERLDHKHLNLDCEEFANLNPSVENIARVICALLDGAFTPARLRQVRVWETPKTYAEVAPGAADGGPGR